MQASLFIVLITTFGIVQNSTYAATVTPPIPDSDCIDKMDQNMHAKASLLDKEKGISAAKAYSGFTSETRSDKSAYLSTFNEYTLDMINCTATLDTTNVVFSVIDAEGVERYVIVSEDPELTKPLKIRVQDELFKASTSSDSTNYAGYQFWGSSSPGVVPVYQAKANWLVPSVQAPNPSTLCDPWCNLAIWPGLSNTASGSTGIVQAGTFSKVFCNPSCTTSYKMWYEFFPASAIECSNAVNLGNNVDTNVYSQAKNGGSQNLYNISVMNLSTGTSCGETGHDMSSMGTPYHGSFINERPKLSGTPVSLPQFTSDTMSNGIVYYDGATRNIYAPYSGGWYHKYTMKNPSPGGTLNIGIGSVGSGGQFLATWFSSANT